MGLRKMTGCWKTGSSRESETYKNQVNQTLFVLSSGSVSQHCPEFTPPVALCDKLRAAASEGSPPQ